MVGRLGFSSDRLSHSYIIDGTFADTLAMAVVCGNRSGERPCKKCAHCDKASRHIHPDITEIKKQDGKHIIGVDQIRALKQDVYIVPNEAEQKAYIVRESEAMNTNAQNAFLQILEEPPAHAVFILCAENSSTLLSTIRSRCVDLKHGLYLPQEADRQALDDDADHDELEEISNEFIEAIKGDNLKLMECMFRIDKLDRHALQSFLVTTRENMVLALKENIRKSSCNNDFSKKLFRAEDAILKAGEMLDLNVSAGNIAGYICANTI